MCNNYSARPLNDIQLDKVKVKVTLEQAMKAQMGVGGQRHAPAALPPKLTRYPLYRRRSGRVLKISPPPGFESRTVHLLASRCTD
jgi:hypothetical protein